MLTKTDFEILAENWKAQLTDASVDEMPILVKAIRSQVGALVKCNPRFDRDRFYNWIGIKA